MRRSRLLPILTFVAGIGMASPIAPVRAEAEVPPSFSKQTILSTDQPFGSSIVVADFDGDGWPDVAAASLYDSQIAWYRNNADGTFSSALVISMTAAGPWSLAAADIDADGRMDLISGSQAGARIAWYRNLGGAPRAAFGDPANNTRTIYKNGTGTFSIATSIAIADLDGDGQWDVVSATQADNIVAWHRNAGGGDFGWSAANPEASRRVISSEGLSPSSLAAGDLDGDGLADLAVTSFNDNTLAWFKGGSGGIGAAAFTRHVISTSQMGAFSVAIADMNGDHRPDLICAAPHTKRIAYFRNLNRTAGATAPFFAPEQIVSGEAGGVESVTAADVNRDGNPDVVSALLIDNKIAWNAGSAPDQDGNIVFGPQMIVSSEVAGPVAAATADFDGDTLIDVASVSQDDRKVAVYLNAADFTGDVTLAPTLLAPTDGTVATGPVTISYTLPEEALIGSVTVSFMRGAALRKLVLAPGGGGAGTHVFTFDPANVRASAEIESGPASLEYGTYVVMLSYQDVPGHAAASSPPAILVVEKADGSTPTTPTVPTPIFAQTGGAVPGAGADGSGVPADATFRTFGVPSINGAGEVAFTASYTSGGGVRNVILGPASDGKITLLTGAGNPVPDRSGVPLENQQFVSFQDVLLNETGAIAFPGTVRGVGAAAALVQAKNDRGIWTNAGDGVLRLVVREGEIAPGLSAKFAAFTSVALSATFTTENPPAGSAGRTDVAFVARLRGVGVTPASNEGLWIHESTSSADGSLRMLLRKGQKLALRNGAAKRVKAFFALAANGGTPGHGRGAVPAGVAVRVLFTDRTQALVRISADGAISDIAMTGDAIAGGRARLVKFGLPTQNTDGGTLATVQFSGKAKSSAMFFASEESGAAVTTRTGEAADGIENAIFSSFKAGVLNQDRNTAFIGLVTGAGVSAGDDCGLWSESQDGTPVLLAREGAQPPGVSDGARWKNFKSVALPDGARGPVFLATMAVPGPGKANPAGIVAENDTGVWAVDTKGVLRLMLRKGDVLVENMSPIRALTLLGNVSGSPAQTRSYNASGEIICRAMLIDGSEVIATVRVP